MVWTKFGNYVPAKRPSCPITSTDTRAVVPIPLPSPVLTKNLEIDPPVSETLRKALCFGPSRLSVRVREFASNLYINSPGRANVGWSPSEGDRIACASLPAGVEQVTKLRLAHPREVVDFETVSWFRFEGFGSRVDPLVGLALI
jgi:hypothetical protein